MYVVSVSKMNGQHFCQKGRVLSFCMAGICFGRHMVKGREGSLGKFNFFGIAPYGGGVYTG